MGNFLEGLLGAKNEVPLSMSELVRSQCAKISATNAKARAECRPLPCQCGILTGQCMIYHQANTRLGSNVSSDKSEDSLAEEDSYCVTIGGNAADPGVETKVWYLRYVLWTI